MAPPLFEAEPNYVNLLDIDDVGNLSAFIETYVLEATLDSVANQVKLRDTTRPSPADSWVGLRRT